MDTGQRRLIPLGQTSLTVEVADSRLNSSSLLAVQKRFVRKHSGRATMPEIKLQSAKKRSTASSAVHASITANPFHPKLKRLRALLLL